jgi:hypothetical protein
LEIGANLEVRDLNRVTEELGTKERRAIVRLVETKEFDSCAARAAAIS